MLQIHALLWDQAVKIKKAISLQLEQITSIKMLRIAQKWGWGGVLF